jgi:mannose-6-phosphate isomerase-like protein (cupin superfamily)
MNDRSTTTDMAAMPVQRPSDPRTLVEARGRFFNSGNAFNRILPAVPPASFIDEPALAHASHATTLVACDQSGAMEIPYPATTPLMLVRYASIAPHDRLELTLQATGAIWYVIGGRGRTSVGTDDFTWATGDVFLTPGGRTTTVTNLSDEAAVLWLVTNEPQLAFDRLRPVTGLDASVDVVHYAASEIARQLDRVVHATREATTSGTALIFSSDREEASRNIMPTLTLSLNTVPPGEHQRTHRHNSAAVTLILGGEGCYSIVGDRRCDWSPFATLVTPATDPHSHHNPSGERALFLIVQDGGFYYHARTMGFTFLEPETSA